jgi:hypothetical protein
VIVLKHLNFELTLSALFNYDLALTALLTGTSLASCLSFAQTKEEVTEEFAAMHKSKHFSLEGLTSEDNYISLSGGEGGVLTAKAKLRGTPILLQEMDRAQLEMLFVFYQYHLASSGNSQLLPILNWLQQSTMPTLADTLYADVGPGGADLGVNDAAADAAHAQRLSKLAFFRTSSFGRVVFGSNTHPVHQWESQKQAQLSAMAAGTNRAPALSAVSRVTFLLTRNFVNVQPNDLWDTRKCVNCDAPNHMGLLCLKARRPNLVCTICCSGVHREKDCEGPPAHPFGIAYFRTRAAGTIERGKARAATVTSTN